MAQLRKRTLVVLMALLIAAVTNGFIVPSSKAVIRSQQSMPTTIAVTSTQLFERQWNFNEGRSPWGLKKNAEIWNGRVAQVC